MNWGDVSYFLAIAREGQMLAAARRMNVSQARLSRHLATLEEALGVRLFDRSTRGCVLTEQGQMFLRTAERIEAEMLEGVSALNRQRQEVTGVLRVGAPDGFGSAYLAPRLGALAEAHPKLRLQLVPAPRSFSLSQREADVAIMIGRPQKGRLIARKLCDYSLGLYASRSYLDRHGTPAQPSDLTERVLIGYVEDLLYTKELDFAGEIPERWQSAIEVSTAYGQFEVVRHGGGIGILHDFMAAGDSTLVRLFPDIRLERTYWLAWHENLRGSQRVAAFVDFLNTQLRGDAAMFLPPAT